MKKKYKIIINHIHVFEVISRLEDDKYNFKWTIKGAEKDINYAEYRLVTTITANYRTLQQYIITCAANMFLNVSNDQVIHNLTFTEL